MSDPATMGQLAQNMSGQIMGIGSLLSPIAYLVGIAFTMRAVLGLKQHLESDGREGISGAVMNFLVGGMMLAVPTFLDVSNQALGLDAPQTHVATLDAAPVGSPDPIKAPAPATPEPKSAPIAQRDPAIPVDAVQPKAQAQASSPVAAAPAVAAPAFHQETAPAAGSDAKLVKEPAHGGSGDLQALLEIVALFASLALGGFYFIAKAAKRGEARRLQVQAAMADLSQVAAPSEQRGPAA